MSGESLSAGISGENATVDTTYLGIPNGSAWQTSSARSVPMVPPSMMIPSARPSCCSFAASSDAPLAMICMAWFSSPPSTASWIELFAAAATSCFEMSHGRGGSPSTPTSIVSARPP